MCHLYSYSCNVGKISRDEREVPRGEKKKRGGVDTILHEHTLFK